MFGTRHPYALRGTTSRVYPGVWVFWGIGKLEGKGLTRLERPDDAREHRFKQCRSTLALALARPLGQSDVQVPDVISSWSLWVCLHGF